MTPKMASRTSQAAPVWEPKNRDRRFSRLGEWITRMTMKVAIDTQHGDGEEVLDEADDRGVADERDGEAAGEQVAEGLDDGEDQDGEAPHGEEVGHAGHGPLEQLLLAGHLDQLGLEPGRDVLGPARHGGLAGADQAAPASRTVGPRWRASPR